MKITGYRLLQTRQEWGRPIGDANGVLDPGVTPVSVVLLDTDEGLTGVGTGSHRDVDVLFQVLEGQDPRATSTLYERMLAQVFKAGHAGATFGGIGALDTALWDLKAKLVGEPLWRLLGAGDRFVPGYASLLDIALTDEELARAYSDVTARGFASGKLKGGHDPATDVRRLAIVEEALRPNSPRPGLMLDANESWNLKQAVRHVTTVESSVDLAWIEEPLRRWDAVGHARLSRSVRAAVATGENLTGLEQFRPLLDAGAVDVVQPGSAWGITHFLRVAAVAHGHDLPVSPVGSTANHAVAHAAAAVPNHLSAEVQHFRPPVGLSVDQEFVDGGIVLGDEPGTGVVVDEALLAEPVTTVPPDSGPHVRPARAGLVLAPPAGLAPTVGGTSG